MLASSPPPNTTSVRRVHDALAPSRERLAARDAHTVRTQVAVSEIPAPTGDEGDRATWIAHRLARVRGLDVRTDEAGNVVASRAGSLGPGAEPVVVCAHLDTVFPRGTPLAVRRDGNRFTGPGIGDNGRGLAAMLAIAEELDEARVATQRPLLFAATTGEEGAGDLRGAKHLFARLDAEPYAAIALDGAGDERVVQRALGSRRVRITYRGEGGHSWAAFGVPNAVHAAAEAGARIARLALPRDPRTTLSVCRIGGGISINAIPDEAWLEVDLRSTSGTMLDRYEQELHHAARAAAKTENARRAPGTPPLCVDVRVIGDRPCGEVDSAHPIVSTAIAATRLVGRDPELASASTDANVPIGRGIPAIAIGAGGRGGSAHTCAEWYDNVDGVLGIARAMTIIVVMAGMA
jgi:acetylornithine deacetylase/succinyl-diaminopimelate desuccinylase-like protein